MPVAGVRRRDQVSHRMILRNTPPDRPYQTYQTQVGRRENRADAEIDDWDQKVYNLEQ
jgi:hypothetical protein